MSNVRIAYDTFQRTAPTARDALLAMGKTADESGVDKEIIELAKLRASQINNCAFCLQIHLNVSRKLGVAQEKLDLVATWHEAGIFSDRECAALAWAESLTRLADRGVPDDGLRRRAQAFQRERGGIPEHRHRHHQRLEPAGRRLPLRAADSEESGGGQSRVSGYLAGNCLVTSAAPMLPACGQPLPSPSSAPFT